MRCLRSSLYINGTVGVFGTYSGGCYAVLEACRVRGFDAVIDPSLQPAAAPADE